MGRYCRICGHSRPNENFSGHGHKIGICNKCKRLGKKKIQEIEDSEFIYDVFYEQSNISKGNIQRLRQIGENATGKDAEIAMTIAEVAKYYPAKKKRFGKLYHNKKPLFDKLVELGFIHDFITPMIEEEEKSEREYEEYVSRMLLSEESEENNNPAVHKTYIENDDLPF